MLPSLQVTRVLGLALSSQFSFSRHTGSSLVDELPDEPASQLCFECCDHPPFPVNWSSGRLVYSRVNPTAEGSKRTELLRFVDFDLLKIPDFADFYIGASRIDCHLLDESLRPWVEIYLMGTILAYWLERQGLPVLHASAVVIGGRTAAFLGHSGHGKSTLASAFLKDGAALLSDDILPLECQNQVFQARPGSPRVNLQPEQVRTWLGTSCETEKVVSQETKVRLPIGSEGIGTFWGRAAPLACVYILSRSAPTATNPEIEILPIPPADAVMRLLRYTFLSDLVEEMGWQPRRLDFFARLVQKVPVRSVSYPSGLEHLSTVTAAIRRDLDTLPSS